MTQAVSALNEDRLFIFPIRDAESTLIPTNELSVLLSDENKDNEHERLSLDSWTGSGGGAVWFEKNGLLR